MPKHIIIANSIRVLLLFLCVSSYCQTPKSGIAEYKVKISTKFLEGLSRQSPIYGEITEAARYMNQLQYNLYFNSEIALYKFQEQLLDEKNRSIENASKIARKTPVYTLQASGEVFNKIEFMGDDYLITHNCSGYEWEINSENRLILGYLCNKATTFVKDRNQELTEITAYFCPQIPFNYGPNGYCGLPGMILYVDDNRIVYEVTEIRFGNTEAIHFDQKGIIKSKESFSQFVDSLARATFRR